VADSYNNLGAITAANGHYKEAVTYFERAAVWNPSFEGLDYNWGRAAFAGSEFTEAILPLSRYVKAHPDDNGARSVLGISHFMAGNYRNCIETLQPLIGKIDLVPQVQYVYAESLVKTGQADAGIMRLEALEKLHPEIPDVHRSLGEALLQQEQKQKATEELRSAIHLSPRDAESHYDLGKLELEDGETAAAIAELEMAVQLLPNSEKFHRELSNAYTAASRISDAKKEMEICAALRTHRTALH
jgi:Flp pilus assembly protein TadD